MKTAKLFAAALAGAGLLQLAPAQAPLTHVSLCVTTGIGTCGNVCEPFQCEPNYTLVSSYETMVFDITGAPGGFYALIAGYAVPGCLPIPGIEGALACWTPAMTVEFGFFGAVPSTRAYPCRPAHADATLDVPFVLPGFDMRFQVLGLNGYLKPAPELSFSRATEVRTR